MKARNTNISGKLMFSAKNGVLSTLLREDEATLRRRESISHVLFSIFIFSAKKMDCEAGFCLKICH